MELVPFNLGDIMKTAGLSEGLIKGFMMMVLRAVAHLHELGLVHRDVKPQNCLIDSSGTLKLCDLGLCRIAPEVLPRTATQKQESESHNWTLQVGTHYYRAPELLLGDRGYSKSVDMWAVGCMLAELLNGEPLFPGRGDIEMIGLISNLLGSPSEESWPGIVHLADFGKIHFREKAKMDIKATFPSWSDCVVDLFEKLIIYEPTRRISAREALHHEWFMCSPAPILAPFDGNIFDLFNAETL
jgi:serine/threonine protein kinase